MANQEEVLQKIGEEIDRERRKRKVKFVFKVIYLGIGFFLIWVLLKLLGF